MPTLVFREVGQIVERPRESRRFYLQGKGATPGEFTDRVAEAINWCDEQFGTQGSNWMYKRNEYHCPNYFEFFDEEISFAFKMRWC